MTQSNKIPKVYYYRQHYIALLKTHSKANQEKHHTKLSLSKTFPYSLNACLVFWQLLSNYFKAWHFYIYVGNKKFKGVIPLWCSAAAAAAAAASRCALSSLAASWAPRAPDRASRLEPPPRARPGCGRPEGCGPTGKPPACCERCCAWSCCCTATTKTTHKRQGREFWVT